MKRTIIIFAFLTLGFVISFYEAFCSPIILVKGHQARANIVIDINSSAQIKNVARIFQDYIRRSSGATLNIENRVNPELAAIHIGATVLGKGEETKLQNLDQDAYLLENLDSKNFLILGKTDWGTEFGVYNFLERFVGVRWLMPTDLGTDIPNVTDLIIPETKIVESPAYLSRALEPINVENSDALGQWGRFNRLRSNIDFIHNLNKLFSVSDPVTSKAQFYSKMNVPNGSDHDWQPNFSAPGISDVAATKIIKYFSQNPQKNSYSLGMNDSKKFDESSASLKRRSGKKNLLGLEDVSDDYYLWANDVAKKVNAVYPNKLFGTLAYNNLIAPPSIKTGVNPNIVPFITSERMRWSNSQFRNADVQLSNSWTSQAKAIGWYDYDYGLCYLLPKVWFHTMQQYLSWGKQNKVRYYFGELYPNWGEGPKSWLMAKLLWNPNQNVDSLLDEWYTRMGGAGAAPKLKAYYAIWEKYWTTDIQKSPWYNVNDQYLKFNDLTYMNNVSSSYIVQSDKLLNDAYSLADSPIRKKRVDELRKMWNVYKYAILATQKYNARYLPSLKQSDDFMGALDQLNGDSIHSGSLSRILMYVSPTRK